MVTGIPAQLVKLASFQASFPFWSIDSKGDFFTSDPLPAKVLGKEK